MEENTSGIDDGNATSASADERLGQQDEQLGYDREEGNASSAGGTLEVHNDDANADGENIHLAETENISTHDQGTSPMPNNDEERPSSAADPHNNKDEDTKEDLQGTIICKIGFDI